PRIGPDRLRLRREEDARTVPHCLRQVHLYRSAGAGHRSRAQRRRATAQREELRGDTRLVNLLRKAIEDTSDDDTGWAQLSRIGQNVNKQSPDFDSRNYGYAKLSGLVKGIGLFDTEERQIGNGKHLYVRPRSGGK